ncbi:MAG: hypothetical protein V7767_00165 [Leeuwenhoekiella sp.]
MKYYPTLMLLIFIPVLAGCGATPGNTDLTATEAIPTFPIYTYLDNKGSAYIMRPGKLEFNPASEENTIDNITDEGYHTVVNISQNEFNKIAAIFNVQLNKDQQDLGNRDPELPVPEISMQTENEKTNISIDLDAVRELNYILVPFIDDQH